MNKPNYLKIFTIAAFALFLGTTVNAQSSPSKMDREKAQPRIQPTEISAKKGDEVRTIWAYSVVRMTIKKDQITVDFDKPNANAKTKSAELAYKMALKNEAGLKEASDSFRTESDVLNYLSDRGLELVSVVIDTKAEDVKTYYLRSKLPE